jgi:flagellar assembly factor FliW
MDQASSITIESSRFGRVEIDPRTVIEFPEGLIGLGGSRYALLARDADSPFLWLHSMEDPALALPVANPHQFFAGFSVELSDEDAERLDVGTDTKVDAYVTVRAAGELEQFTANLKAPILIWRGQGHQVINQAQGCALRAPLFTAAAAQDRPPERQAC